MLKYEALMNTHTCQIPQHSGSPRFIKSRYLCIFVSILCECLCWRRAGFFYTLYTGSWSMLDRCSFVFEE